MFSLVITLTTVIAMFLFALFQRRTGSETIVNSWMDEKKTTDIADTFKDSK